MTTLHRFYSIRLVHPAIFGICFGLILTANVTTRASEGQLPKGEVLLDKYVAATGGMDAYAKIKNRVTKGTMEFVGQGIKLTLTVVAAKPNLVHTVIESDATGKIESGTDGKVVWENSLLKGPAIKEGMERRNALRDSRFDRIAYWKRGYEKAECVGDEDIDGTPCFKVVLSPKPAPKDQKPGSPLTLYIEKESSLVSKFESNVVTAAGTIPVEAHLTDYRKVDGLLISHTFVMKVLGQERRFTTESIKQNVELPDDCFELPESIRALVEKRKTEDATREPAVPSSLD